MTRALPVWLLVAVAAIPWAATGSRSARAQEECGSAPDVEINHVPLAVTDLEAAAATFRDLGFTLKPGRDHANGLRNVHAKFADGREIELITADAARDPLSAWYREHLARGDGPAFLAFYAGPVAEVAARLADPAGAVGGGVLSFPPGHRWRHLFFGGTNRSSTDRPEHFVHPVGASTLHAVWIAAAEHVPELELLGRLGAVPCGPEVRIGDLGDARVVPLRGSALYLLGAGAQFVPGRRIVGMTVLVESLQVARGVLGDRPVAEVRIAGEPGLMVRVHGTWLELRQAAAVSAPDGSR